MSIAVDNPPMAGSGFMVAGGKRNRPVFMVQPAEIRHRSDRESDSSSSSSIGTNSSSGEGRDSDDEGGEMEVRSAFKGPFQTMDSLEESLPIRRGISNFYAGKSKSFTSLCNVASSAKDLVKPEDPYNKKRRNVLLRTVASDRNFHPCRTSNTGISKRPTNSGKTTLALAVAMNNTGKECEDQSLPPLPPSGKSFGNPNHLFSDSLQRCSSSSSSSNGCEESSPRKWGFTVRSFSLFDLQAVSNYNGEEEA